MNACLHMGSIAERTGYGAYVKRALDLGLLYGKGWAITEFQGCDISSVRRPVGSKRWLPSQQSRSPGTVGSVIVITPELNCERPRAFCLTNLPRLSDSLGLLDKTLSASQNFGTIRVIISQTQSHNSIHLRPYAVSRTGRTRHRRCRLACNEIASPYSNSFSTK